MATEWIGCNAQPADKDSVTASGYTFIFDEPATISGRITQIEFYATYATAGVIDIAVFKLNAISSEGNLRSINKL